MSNQGSQHWHYATDAQHYFDAEASEASAAEALMLCRGE